MALVDVITARRELRAPPETADADIQRKLATAEEQVFLFLGRNVYETSEDLAAARAAAPAVLAAASSAHEAAMAAAALVTDTTQRGVQERFAKDDYNAAIEGWDRTMRGMLATDTIRTAILMVAANLLEHAGDEPDVPGVSPAAYDLLWLLRAGLGV